MLDKLVIENHINGAETRWNIEATEVDGYIEIQEDVYTDGEYKLNATLCWMSKAEWGILKNAVDIAFSLQDTKED